MCKALIICLLLALAVYIRPQDELADKLAALKQDIAARNGMVFEAYQGNLEGKPKRYEWELERNRNYHVWVVADVPLDDIVAQAEVYREATPAPVRWEIGTTPYYRWQIETFASGSRNLSVQLRHASGGSGRYAVVLASSGRGLLPPPAIRVYDAQGDCYHLINNVVYRNGTKHYENKKFEITSIAVTPGGTLYMLTREGAALSINGIIYKGAASHPEQAIVKMVCCYDSRVFLLRADNNVLDRTGGLVYRRTDDETVADLVEERWVVWIIARNGKRIKP